MADFAAGRAVLVAAAAVALAGCGGSTSPRVASLGKSGGGGTARSASTLPTGDPTRLMDEWATCMRRHGDPDQRDPTITAGKLIVIDLNPATDGGIYGTNKGGQGNSGPGQYCREYITAAQTDLRGGRPLPARPDLVTLLRFSTCMQSHGVPDFPDPTSAGLSIPMDAGGDLNPSSPTFHDASQLCEKKTGANVPGGGLAPPPGTVELAGAGLGAAGG